MERTYVFNFIFKVLAAAGIISILGIAGMSDFGSLSNAEVFLYGGVSFLAACVGVWGAAQGQSKPQNAGQEEPKPATTSFLSRRLRKRLKWKIKSLSVPAAFTAKAVRHLLRANAPAAGGSTGRATVSLLTA